MSNPYIVPAPPDVDLKETQWYVPTRNALYEWYEQAVKTLQSARAAIFRTGGQCPNCGAARAVHDTPVSASCSACGWHIDLRRYKAVSPVEYAARIRNDLKSARGLLLQVKNDVTYRGVDAEGAYRLLISKIETLEEHAKDMESLRAHKFVILLLN
jgi:hypothetical protein